MRHFGVLSGVLGFFYDARPPFPVETEFIETARAGKSLYHLQVPDYNWHSPLSLRHHSIIAIFTKVDDLMNLIYDILFWPICGENLWKRLVFHKISPHFGI